jgi:hypothetical protein
MRKRRAAPRLGDSYFNATPKIAVPADGQATAFTIGSTWWAKQWISALENLLGGDAGRLARGRTYARGGRVSRVAVEGSEVTARVTGSRVYQVTIAVHPLTDAAWSAAVTAMAGQASFTAALLNGTTFFDLPAQRCFQPHVRNCVQRVRAQIGATPVSM